MTCPYCRAPLNVREYAWTHRHPSRIGRLLGAAMMVAGTLTAAIGLGELVR